MLKSPRQMTTSERQARWPNFSDHEIACQCCGAFSPSQEFTALMDDAQTFRNESGKPLPINSGYRCAHHGIETKKATPGMHTQAACDFAVAGDDALKLLQFFLNKGYVGIGINQKGNARYIHIDRRTEPAMWSY